MPGVQFFDTQECEWSDQDVSISGAPLIKVLGVAHGVRQELEYIRGAGKKPLGINGGNKEFPFEIRVLKGAMDDLNAAARIAGGEDFTDVEFDTNFSYQAKGARGITTSSFLRCRCEGFEYRWNQGEKKMEIVLSCLATDRV